MINLNTEDFVLDLAIHSDEINYIENSDIKLDLPDDW